VYAADFVSHEEGTGVVHVAPAFGEDDADLARREGLPVLQPVGPDGRFLEGPGGPVAGQFFKDADQPLLQILKDTGKLYRLAKHKHTYPFCWRCETPLMYFATDSWYIGMSRLRDEIKAVNEQVQWFPESYKWGRFGDFLENLKDWSLSRERFWGTPLPVWRCPQGHEFVPGSYAELKERSVGWTEPFDPHRPTIDELEVVCGTCQTRMAREPYVIDTWFDSGSCPFAQFHYPMENKDLFEASFPADYIAEGVDQTRGWFYSMMAISTAIWGKPAYKRVLVNGLVLDKDGAKMSKSKGNVVDPWVIFDKEGADALRWYLFTQSPPWHDKRFDASFAREAVAKFLLPYWNSYAFLATYGAIDGFDPDTAPAEPPRHSPLDRWLASRLSRTVAATTEALEAMDVHKAARSIEDFVVQDLSTWWIRRSRDRFWAEEDTADKASAYASLHRALQTVSLLAAPFAPFIADKVWRALRRSGDAKSVHLARWPEVILTEIDDALEASMAKLRAFVETGHRLRNEGGVKTRVPLREAAVVAGDAAFAALEPLLPLLTDELNVKAVRRAPSKDPYLTRTFRVPIKRLGPRFRGEAKAVAEAVERLPTERVAAMVDAGKPVTFEYNNGRKSAELPAEYFEVESEPKPPFAVADVGAEALVLNLELTDDLRAEGLAREVIRLVQRSRKEAGLHVEDRIRLALDLDDGSWRALEPHLGWVGRETQADAVERAPAGSGKAAEIDGMRVGVVIARAGP
jgi:isoleucyl-tRNA synthetase